MQSRVLLSAQRLIAFLAIVTSIAVIPGISHEAVAENQTVDVSITQGASTKTTDAYSPNPIEIDVGDSVVWKNNDLTLHTATSGIDSTADGKFGGDSENIALLLPGETQNFTFSEAGVYPYYCVLHPNMVGEVIVGQAEISITVETDRPSYEIGDDVTVNGNVLPVEPELPLLIKVTSEDGTLIRIDQVTVDPAGSFSYSFHLGGPLFEEDLSYPVIVDYAGASAETSFFISSPTTTGGSCQTFVPTIVGTEEADVIEGTEEDDVIFGLGGDDVIYGLSGNDKICGGPGDDTISGGDGDDRVSGGRGNDLLYGDDGNDMILGGTGYDHMFGGDGEDALLGGRGNDVLEGGEGVDSLDGQEGDDSEEEGPGDLPDGTSIEVELDDVEYGQGDEVLIAGTIPQAGEGDQVKITVHEATGESDSSEVELDENGGFGLEYVISDDADDGVYKVEVQFEDQNPVFSYFLVDEEEDTIFVETDGDGFAPGDTVRIFGEATDPSVEEGQVSIAVLDPNGESIVDDKLADGDADAFQYLLDLDSDSTEGRYSVIAASDQGEGFHIFEVISDGAQDSVDVLVETDDLEYGPGDDVTITGVVDNGEEGSEVKITIHEPGSGSDSADTEIDNDDGDFRSTYDLSNSAEDGIYKVEVEFAGDSVFTYFLVNEDDDTVYVITDQDEYEPDGEVIIEGEVADPVLDVDEVKITVIDPTGEEILAQEEVQLDGDTFAFEFQLDDELLGRYAVIVEYDDQDAGFFIFEVKENGGGGSGREIAASLSKASYRPGDEVVVAGDISEDDIDVGLEIFLEVKDPAGEEIADDSTEPLVDGSFEFRLELGDKAEEGRYEVMLSYEGYNPLVLTFDVDGADAGSGITVIDQSPYGVDHVKMASWNDYVYLVWAKGNDDYVSSIYFRASNDGGKTFGPITRITEDTGPDAVRAQSPDVMVSEGNVYVAWAAFTDEVEPDLQIYFAASYDNGQSFTPVKKMKTPVEVGRIYAWNFRLAASGDHVYVTWLNEATALFAASHDRGITFEPTKIIEKGTAGALPEIAAEGNKVYLVWNSDDYDREDRYKIFLAASSDYGDTFGAPYELSIGEGSSGENHDIYSDIALNNGTIFVSWMRATGGFEEYVISKIERISDHELSFDEPVIVDRNSYPCSLRSWGPQLGFSGSDFVYLLYSESCWREDGPNKFVGKVTIAISDDGGESFAEPKSVADDEFGPYGEQFVVIDNKIFVAWVGENYSEEYGCCDSIRYSIMLSSSSDFGETFSDVKTLYNDSNFGLSPPAMAANNDNLHVAWSTNGYGGGSVLLSTAETDIAGSIPSSISAFLSKTSYIQGDTVLMAIDVDNGDPAEDAFIAVQDPDGAIVVEETVEATNDGFFTFEFDLSDGARTGQYEAVIKYMENQELLTFYVEAQFAPWINLSNNPGPSFDPVTAASGDHVYVAWLDGSTTLRNWGVFFAKSDDGGSAFSEAAQVSTADDTAYFPAMAADGNDLYLVWLGADHPDGVGILSDVILRASHDGGESFGDLVTLAHHDVELGNSSDFLELGPPKVYATENEVYVVWSDVYHVYFRVSHDKGVTFESTVVLEASDREGGQVGDLHVSASGEHLHVAWQLYAGSLDDVFVRSSHDRGANFEQSINVSNNGGTTGAWLLQMVSSDENVYLTWQQSSSYGGYSVALAASNDNGATYSAPHLLGGVIASSAAGPVIAASGSDVYVLWNSFSMILAVSHDGGRNFEPLMTLGAGSGDFPLISATEDNVYVAWTMANLYTHNTLFRASSDTGATFNDLTSILEDHPDVARSVAASGNNAYVVWSGDEVSIMKVSGNQPTYPTLDPSTVLELTNGSISNSYGINVEFVRSDAGYLGGGIPPVGPDGEGPPPEPNALLISSVTTLWHHRIIICGPDDICIDDGGGGGLVSGSEGDAGLYQFYPLNEVSWGLGDLVHIWMLVSDTAPNGEPIGTSQWVDIGDIPIEECASELWCPANTNHV